MVSLLGCSSGEPERESVGLRFEEGTDEAVGRVVLGPLDPSSGSTAIDRAVAAGASELQKAFAVWAGQVEVLPGGCARADGLQPLLGRYGFRSGSLQFEPRFPWIAGSTYTACVDPEVLQTVVPGLRISRPSPEPLELRFTVSAAPHETPPAPRVERVWPSSPSVPANLLRVYVWFDQPMSRRDVSSRISLIRESGEAISEPFVEIPNGLWDPQLERLTLFVHPGRVKRGVGPHERLGPVLIDGQQVRLRVDPGLESRLGVGMEAAFERSYRVTAADRSSPDPSRWRLEPPGSRMAPATLHFDEVLDREQLRFFVRVIGDDERAPRGVATPAADGRSWSFLPAEGWSTGRYRILVRHDIEDLAGNTPGRLFDSETRGLGDSSDTEAAPSVTPDATQGPALTFPFDVSFEPRETSPGP